MLIDTHCHINMMVKSNFDVPLSAQEVAHAKDVIDAAKMHSVTTIINVGTSVVESENCITLAQQYDAVWAAVGIHPNDCTPTWRKDLDQLKRMVIDKEINKIVAIGECGLDRHYPDYDIQRQKDAFKAQIELALEHDLALIVHTRDAYEETLRSLEEFKGQITRGVIHCFSEDQAFADTAIDFGFVIGMGGTITYPKNNALREIIAHLDLTKLVLETDAPFLPLQEFRGKQNHPQSINPIAHYIAELRLTSFEEIADATTKNAQQLFGLNAR